MGVWQILTFYDHICIKCHLRTALYTNIFLPLSWNGLFHHQLALTWCLVCPMGTNLSTSFSLVWYNTQYDPRTLLIIPHAKNSEQNSTFHREHLNDPGVMQITVKENQGRMLVITKKRSECEKSLCPKMAGAYRNSLLTGLPD